MTVETAVNGEVALVADVVGDGPSVVLLHGWPDTAALWDGVATRLADAGFRAVAVDLRGCGRSSKPTEVSAYKMAQLVGDVAAVIDQLCGGTAHVVGHDWGANLAWVSAAYLPASVERLVAVSVGHPTSFRSAGIAQQVRSWYVLLFEHEGIAETWLSRDDYAVMREWTRHPDIDAVVARYDKDGSLTTHLNWYRANFTASSWIAPPPVLPSIQVPALGIWSTDDLALTEGQMTGSAPYCEAGFDFHRMEGLGHWIPLEDPAALSFAVTAFLSKGRA